MNNVIHQPSKEKPKPKPKHKEKRDSVKKYKIEYSDALKSKIYYTV